MGGGGGGGANVPLECQQLIIVTTVLYAHDCCLLFTNYFKQTPMQVYLSCMLHLVDQSDCRILHVMSLRPPGSPPSQSLVQTVKTLSTDVDLSVKFDILLVGTLKTT